VKLADGRTDEQVLIEDIAPKFRENDDIPLTPDSCYNRHLQKRNYGTYLWGQGEAYGISRCLIFPLNYRP
jgi:hypothetical protein